MTEIIAALSPVIIALIYYTQKAIITRDNNKTRIEMYKLAIKAGHKHGMIDNNHTKF